MSNQPFFYDSPLRAAFLANMAARLKDQICEDAQQQFDQLQLLTPVTDVSLVLFVNHKKIASIAEIAEALDYSHQRVAARINALIRLNLLSRQVDSTDQRRKAIKLTEVGLKEVAQIDQFYRHVSAVFEELFKEIDCELMEKLLAAVNGLKRSNLSSRLKNIQSTP